MSGAGGRGGAKVNPETHLPMRSLIQGPYGIRRFTSLVRSRPWRGAKHDVTRHPLRDRPLSSLDIGRLGLRTRLTSICNCTPDFLRSELKHGYSWFSRDVTKILKSKPGGLQKFYLHLRKGYLKIYSCTIP